MRILPKNLLKFKSLSNLSNRTPKAHHIFQTAAAAASASAADAAKNNHRLLLRRLSWSGLDEDKIFSDISSKNFSEPSSPTSEFSDSQDLQFLCGTATNYYTALSPDTFSPIKTHNFPHFNDYNVLSSCGGVVCLDNDTEDVVFWNPTTNEVKFLPQSEEERTDPEDIHPLNMFTRVGTTGFGFDSKSQDYKYVRWLTVCFERKDECGLWHYEGANQFAEMYSLKRDSWKIIHYPNHIVYAGRDETAFINGHLFWSIFTSPRKEIMRFDLATEEFTCFPFPHTRKKLGVKHLHKLFDFGGRLGVVVYPVRMGIEEEIDGYVCSCTGSESSFELWVWNEGWWSKEFDDCIEGAHEPLGFSQDGRLLFLVGIDYLLHVYDIHTKKLKECDIYCNPHRCDLIPYVESLVPLHRT